MFGICWPVFLPIPCLEDSWRFYFFIDLYKFVFPDISFFHKVFQKPDFMTDRGTYNTLTMVWTLRPRVLMKLKDSMVVFVYLRPPLDWQTNRPMWKPQKLAIEQTAPEREPSVSKVWNLKTKTSFGHLDFIGNLSVGPWEPCLMDALSFFRWLPLLGRGRCFRVLWTVKIDPP